MKKYIFPALKLSLVFIIICSVFYPLLISLAGRMAPGGGKGETVICLLSRHHVAGAN